MLNVDNMICNWYAFKWNNLSHDHGKEPGLGWKQKFVREKLRKLAE